MPLEKFGSGSSLQSLLRFAPQRISTAILHASSDFRFQNLYFLNKLINPEKSKFNPCFVNGILFQILLIL